MARISNRPANVFERQIGNFFYAALWTLGLLPRPIGLWIGNNVGLLWWTFSKNRKSIVLNNLEIAYGREKSADERRSLARRVFMNISIILYEMGWSLRLSPKRFDSYFRIEGKENYDEAGKGVLLLTGHIGNWELLPIILAVSGQTANILYRPLDFKPLDHLFIKMRTRFGGQMISRSGTVMKLFKLLRKGENIAILLDQSVGMGNGVFVDFFGRRASTNKGLAMLAIRTGAPVVPVFNIREGDGYVTRVLPALPLIRTGDKRKDIEENTQQYNNSLEAIIRRYPDQWFWVHRRWKIKPYREWTNPLQGSS